MKDHIAVIDAVDALSCNINAARVFLESFNDKLDYMSGLFLDAEDKLRKAEDRCKELEKLLKE